MKAPFSILFSEPPDGVVDVSVQLLRGEMVSAITDSFVSLNVEDLSGTFSGPQYRVRGTIANGSVQTLGRIAIVVTIYDSEQHVIGYRHHLLGDDMYLNSGQRENFSILLTPQIIGDVYTYQVIAWAVVK